MAIFDCAHPKIIELTFSFAEFVPTCKKITLFHLFIFQIQPMSESHDQTGHTLFWPDWPHPVWPFLSKKFLISFYYFWEPVSTCKNPYLPSVYSSDTVNFRVPPPDRPYPFLTMLMLYSLWMTFNCCVLIYNMSKLTWDIAFILLLSSLKL